METSRIYTAPVPPQRRWPVSARLTLVLTALVVAAVMSVTLLAINREQRTFRMELQQQAQLLLDTLSTTLADPLYTQDVSTLEDTLESLAGQRVLVYGRVFNQEGRIVADAYNPQLALSPEIDPLGRLLLASDTTVFDWQAYQLQAGQAIVLGNQRIGAISIGLSTEALGSKIAQLRNESATAAIIIAAIGGLLAFLFMRTFTTKLHRLAQVTQHIAAGDLNQKLVIQGEDELTILANAFNEMTARLRQTLESLASRTQELEHKNEQSHASADVARQIGDIRDIPALLESVVQTVAARFGLYHAGVFLLDEEGNTAFLQAASSEAGKRMLERGYRVQVGEPNAIGIAARQRKPHVVTHTDGTETPFTNPDLPLTRSEVALPLIVRGRLIGVIDLQSEQAQAFGQDEAEILQTLADQVAVSIENIRLLNETQTLIGQLESLTVQQTQDLWQRYTKRRAAPAYQYTPLGISPLKEGATRKDTKGLQIPLRLRGQEIGKITLQRGEKDPLWSDRDRELAEKIAAQVALALDNNRLIEESRRRAAQEQTISEISGRLGRSLDVETLLQTTARELGSLPDVSEVSVFIGESNESGGG